jgi:hypothetical protein
MNSNDGRRAVKRSASLGFYQKRRDEALEEVEVAFFDLRNDADILRQRVDEAREKGASWEEIGEVMGGMTDRGAAKWFIQQGKLRV